MPGPPRNDGGLPGIADETVKAALAGKTVRKVVVVPGKIVNIVTS